MQTKNEIQMRLGTQQKFFKKTENMQNKCTPPQKKHKKNMQKTIIAEVWLPFAFFVALLIFGALFFSHLFSDRFWHFQKLLQ